ncbi:uncharacterized protein [Labrus bergylta]|uniref:uncharacterized protein n=1 Tax=Labrus bergylta TaxID=56723 RepID=UPI003313D750
MLFLVLLMTMMMKSDAVELVTARSGDRVLMTSQRLKEARLQPGWDVRWTHLHLVMSRSRNVEQCHHKRCKQQSDGSLLFSQVQSQDAGRYSMEVFDASGQRQLNETFLLEVEEAGLDKHGGSSVLVGVFMFLLLVFIAVFIVIIMLRRRSRQRMTSAGPLQENVYIVMHGHHGNKTKNVEDIQDKEEESHYVSCYPVVSMETQITGQKSVDEEDIYV